MSRTRFSGIRPVKELRKLERGFWNAAVPSTCVVPLQQHVGSSIAPLVKKGDVVREGMIIADGPGRFAVPIHAPIPGKVSFIGTTRLFDGTSCPAIMIELFGEFDRLGRETERRQWESLDPPMLLESIHQAGVVAYGASPLPLHLLLRRNALERNAVVVLDLAETEPYLTADTELTCTYPDAVAEGFNIIASILGSNGKHVVSSGGNGRALRAVRRVLGRSVRVHRVAHRFPANLESQIRAAILGSRSGNGQSFRVMPIRPSTAYAVYEAVVLAKPQIERVIAVGGGAVARPAHVRVRIGTAVADILAECGGLTETPSRVIAGGPLTGSIVTNINAPIVKNTTAVVALTAKETGSGDTVSCIRCGACVRACPVAINPTLIHDLIRAGRMEEAEQAGLSECVECGLCSHVCPARIPLVQRIRESKR